MFLAAFLGAWIYIRWLALPTNVPDFTVFYAAGKPGPIYDVEWLTAQQHVPGHLRPYAHPPTVLLLLRPIAVFPFPVAFALWAALGAATLVEGAVRLAPRSWWLIGLSAPVFVALALGQMSVLVGGLIALGFYLLPRPLLAGVAFGLAASIKPQLLMLVPVGLLLWGQPRAVLAMGATGLAVIAASLTLGPHLWIDWLQALPRFARINADIGLMGTAPAMPWRLLILAGAVVLMVACRAADTATKAVVTLAATLFTAPHVSIYDFAILAPALAAANLPLGPRTPAALVPLLVAGMPWWGYGVASVWTVLAERLGRIGGIGARLGRSAGAARYPKPFIAAFRSRTAGTP